MPTPRPNIIHILVDDLGFSDIGCFGAEIATPNLDALAARGVRGTQFYNCARCCPTRASLVTGLYPHRAGIGHMVEDRGHPAYRGFIDPQRATLAERLREGGYSTWMSGKWHVGGSYDVTDPTQWQRDAGDAKHPLPTQRGFDRFYGILCGACSFFDPRTLRDQDRFVQPQELPADYYFTDELGTRAVGFIAEAAALKKPFFGYLAFTAPHWPLQAPEADIREYRGRYAGGWDELRTQRLQKLVAEGLLPADQALSQRDEKSLAWADAPDQAWEAERMAVYAAQVSAMDRAVGRVVEALKVHGQFENTLIVFCSDNGGCAEYLREDGATGQFTERYSLRTKTGSQCTTGNFRTVMPGPAETFMSYDVPWANASNTPFRKFKSWTHEGGISSPLIVSWPQGLPAGGITHAAAHIIDLVATACAAAGANGDDLDGVDLLPAWSGTFAEAKRAEFLCWEHQGHAAVRDGAWKAVRAHGQPWELYDLSRDRVEEQDCATTQPKRLAALTAAWQKWADRCGVLPWPVR